MEFRNHSIFIQEGLNLAIRSGCILPHAAVQRYLSKSGQVKQHSIFSGARELTHLCTSASNHSSLKNYPKSFRNICIILGQWGSVSKVSGKSETKIGASIRDHNKKTDAGGSGKNLLLSIHFSLVHGLYPCMLILS